MPAMCDVPVIANKLGITIDELITGTPTKAVNIQRTTGLSTKAIETLQQMRKFPFLLVINSMLENEYFFVGSTFQLRDIVNMKKALYAGEMCYDYDRTRNAIRGAQSEMIGLYGSLIKAITNDLAKKALKAEGRAILEDWQQRGYAPMSDEECENMFYEQWEE